MKRRYVQTGGGIRRTWYVERIWELAEALPETEMAIEDVNGLDEVTWFSPDQLPTVREVAEHSRRILNCDLSFPIILTDENKVFDGMHRLARCYLDGRERIRVKRFPVNPEPDEICEV